MVTGYSTKFTSEYRHLVPISQHINGAAKYLDGFKGTCHLVIYTDFYNRILLETSQYHIIRFPHFGFNGELNNFLNLVR